MNRFVSCGLGLFMAASACSVMAAPIVGSPPASIAKWTQTDKAPAVSKGADVRVKASQDKPCPYRRS